MLCSRCPIRLLEGNERVSASSSRPCGWSLIAGVMIAGLPALRSPIQPQPPACPLRAKPRSGIPRYGWTPHVQPGKQRADHVRGPCDQAQGRAQLSRHGACGHIVATGDHVCSRARHGVRQTCSAGLVPLARLLHRGGNVSHSQPPLRRARGHHTRGVHVWTPQRTEEKRDGTDAMGTV